jgi:RNA polymerase sigma-70 factor, ECF subfamily
LYDVLVCAEPSPVIELNRAVAMRDGPEAGLALIDGILARGDLVDYHLAHAARADLCRQIFEAKDFGENLTPELRQQEERQRAAIEKGTSL